MLRRLLVVLIAGLALAATEGERKAGVLQLEVVHTRSRAVADLSTFAAPLKEATGVWFSGESQFRLVDVYRDTETHGELWAVLVTRDLAEVLGNRIAV
jgi:cyanophycinase